jgi:alkanesulfonate monooxygenase SsuD/methylene tetrahydromethanopterin reductase-like flavin-dependent oxidoreductase (luciferase family)
MKVGVSLFAQNYTDWDRFEAIENGDRSLEAVPPKVLDSQIYSEQFRLGDHVEPLGFDSLWTVEHHFTPYTMVNNPFQLLSYFAGRTERIEMGTMVVVAPWHDPLRVAEQFVALDYMLQGRQVKIGLGRGLGDREFGGLRVDMNESRGRFLETIEIVRKALSNEWFEHHGEYYDIPRLSLRPQPRTDGLADQLYCAWGSPSTLPYAANAGLKPMFIPSKGWSDYHDELKEFNDIRAKNGLPNERATAVTWVYCSESHDEAYEGAVQYMAEYGNSAQRHYKLLGEHFAQLQGYDHYAKMSQLMRDAQGSGVTNDVYVQNHVWGTPDECLERLQNINQHMGVEELVGVFQYGSMPVELAEKSMRLFAKEVLPAAQSMALAPVPA